MIGENASKIIKQSKDLVHHTWEYYRLKGFVQVVNLFSMLIKVLILSGLLMIALLFFGMALTQFLGETLENEILGYALTGFVFLLIAGLVYGIRKKIENKVVRELSKNFFEE